MSSQDICSYYLVVYLNQRYPNQLIENFNRIVDPNTLETCSDLVRTSKPLKDLNLKFKNKNLESKLNKLNINTLFDLVNSFNLHSVPYSARFTLVNWYLKNKFDLVLFINHIPSSKDVLCMQAQSKRCVSLIANKIDSLIMNERDPLSFLLHDLVHAYKMFSNDYLLKGQVGFSKAMLRIYQTEDRLVQDFLESLCSEDQTFSNDFDYLISDMNSHPKHLFFYFKAILINAFKRKFKIDFLAGQSLLQFDRIFESILDIFKMNDKQKELARRMLFEVNSTSCSNKDQTKPFNLIDFTFLDNFFLEIS